MREEEFRQHVFRDDEAALLTDETQFDFFNTNPSFADCWVFPLSSHVHGAALRAGHQRIGELLSFIDFALVKRLYRNTAFDLGRNWLKHLGLGFTVGGIDVAELDTPCQFLLFDLVLYLSDTAERVIRAHPEIRTFYIVREDPPLPLDFYFDSDVPAAILASVCERLGRQALTVIQEQRTWLIAHKNRPHSDAQNPQPMPAIPSQFMGRAATGRIGFAPTTLLNFQEILDACRAVSDHVLICSSTWGLPWILPRETDQTQTDQLDFTFRLSSEPTANTEQYVGELERLWTDISTRLPESSLPDAIRRNEAIKFQFEYIVKRRWLSYAHMIDRAATLVRDVPLDLFILCDHFTAEAGILSRLYRSAGTPILVASHSAWPVDRTWGTWAKSDYGLVPSREAASKLRKLSGMSKVFVAGRLRPPVPRSLRQEKGREEKLREIRASLGRRKLVLFVSNAPEILTVPLVDLKRYFESASTLANVPRDLRETVLVAVRSKPRPLGEDPALYRGSAGFSQESVDLLNGLSFSDCLDLADCVVGVDCPTTGYFEVIERDIPLLHVQTSEVVVRAPELPASILGQVERDEDVWPAIRSLLFDEKHRSRVLRIQREFLQQDTKTNVKTDGPPLPALLRSLMRGQKRSFWSVLRNKEEWKGPAETEGGTFAPKTALSIRDLEANAGMGAGYVDDVLVGTDGSGLVHGWAIDLEASRPASSVHLFVNRIEVARSIPSLARPDVATIYANPAFQQCGFALRFHGTPIDAANTTVSVWSRQHDGTSYELIFPSELAALAGNEKR